MPHASASAPTAAAARRAAAHAAAAHAAPLALSAALAAGAFDPNATYNATLPLLHNATNATNATSANATAGAAFVPPPPPRDDSLGDSATSARAFYDDAICSNAMQIVRLALDGQIYTNTYGPDDPPPPPPPPPYNVSSPPPPFGNGTNGTLPPALPPPPDPNASNITYYPPPLLPPLAPPPSPPLHGDESGQCYFNTCREFTFYREPIVDAITPTGGPRQGGFTVTALGGRFNGMRLNSSIARCAFGSLHVPVHSIPHSGILNCSTPPLPYAHLPSLSLNGVDFTHSSVRYRAYPQSIRHMWPLGHPLGSVGGYAVTLIGDGRLVRLVARAQPMCRFLRATIRKRRVSSTTRRGCA